MVVYAPTYMVHLADLLMVTPTRYVYHQLFTPGQFKIMPFYASGDNSLHGGMLLLLCLYVCTYPSMSAVDQSFILI